VSSAGVLSWRSGEGGRTCQSNLAWPRVDTSALVTLINFYDELEKYECKSGGTGKACAWCWDAVESQHEFGKTFDSHAGDVKDLV